MPAAPAVAAARSQFPVINEITIDSAIAAGGRVLIFRGGKPRRFRLRVISVPTTGMVLEVPTNEERRPELSRTVA